MSSIERAINFGRGFSEYLDAIKCSHIPFSRKILLLNMLSSGKFFINCLAVSMHLMNGEATIKNFLAFYEGKISSFVDFSIRFYMVLPAIYA